MTCCIDDPCAVCGGHGGWGEIRFSYRERPFAIPPLCGDCWVEHIVAIIDSQESEKPN